MRFVIQVCCAESNNLVVSPINRELKVQANNMVEQILLEEVERMVYTDIII